MKAPERFYAIMRIEGGEICLYSTTSNSTSAHEQARTAAVHQPTAVFVVMEPKEAYRAKPLVAETVYLEWPEPEAVEAPPSEREAA